MKNNLLEVFESIKDDQFQEHYFQKTLIAFQLGEAISKLNKENSKYVPYLLHLSANENVRDMGRKYYHDLADAIEGLYQ